eukprot:gnl/TRDRNA2_/TRDRNA2_176637_c3_seq1.p2 gnl/TRDRNA2_/TRDRNA2_176637_c3~~gnl/TRDRNA2_/TRDRNA2_176637_c3_seq1.p2  ORF type:complete len:155 (+),score=55.24 gnl/TRDRNA2_/TRDRNA2_176637_c3_seq1:71-466(+)
MAEKAAASKKASEEKAAAEKAARKKKVMEAKAMPDDKVEPETRFVDALLLWVSSFCAGDPDAREELAARVRPDLYVSMQPGLFVSNAHTKMATNAKEVAEEEESAAGSKVREGSVKISAENRFDDDRMAGA